MTAVSIFCKIEPKRPFLFFAKLNQKDTLPVLARVAIIKAVLVRMHNFDINRRKYTGPRENTVDTNKRGNSGQH